MVDQSENYNHPFYKFTDMKDAQAVGYTFVNPEKQVFFPFKFPELAEDEIRANITYTGLCHTDCFYARNRWFPVTYPLTPGHEILGVVSEVGSSVKDFKKGDQVAFGIWREFCGNCKYCGVRNRENICQKAKNKFVFDTYFGGFCTHLQQPAKYFFKLPSGFDITKGAPLLCAGATVWSPITRYVRPGDKTAVLGIGGVGHLAVQFLAKMGYEVLAFTSSDDKKNMIKSLGATEVINMNNPEEFDKTIGQIDLIINTLPTSHEIERLFRICAPAARWCQIGIPDKKEFGLKFPIEDVVFKEIEILGSLVATRKEINEMIKFCVENNVYPIVEEFSFQDFPKAVDRLENGKPIFRCVVNVEEYSKSKGLYK
jgi:uncharacterized zinc-type alcohol dehydrogenase-like protein